MRRAVLLTAAGLLLAEALVFAAVGLVAVLAVRRQRMSVGGLSSDAMADGAWAGLGLLVLVLLVCAVVAGRAALLRGPGPGGGRRGAGRVAWALLVGGAVLHGLLGAVLLGLAGVPVFAGLMVVLAVLVLALLVLREPEPAGPPEPTAPAAAQPA
ncbi:hypothetical protein ACIQGZ_14510 [Streptomyces sp. NPDC092296]|uniref:hypothetical protein n=1 Tax=Streptomyces sp. NPDC092296 TaxID=3366012 RepID=UPI0037FCE240